MRPQASQGSAMQTHGGYAPLVPPPSAAGAANVAPDAAADPFAPHAAGEHDTVVDEGRAQRDFSLRTLSERARRSPTDYQQTGEAAPGYAQLVAALAHERRGARATRTLLPPEDDHGDTVCGDPAPALRPSAPRPHPAPPARVAPPPTLAGPTTEASRLRVRYVALLVGLGAIGLAVGTGLALLVRAF